MGKDGIPYFPLDTLLDSKFELIEAEFGLTGFGVVVKLYQSIYGQQGYYLEWTDEVALLFARKIGLGGSVVSEIVSASIKRGIFDQRLYENYRILTSKGIQERYFEAVSRRKKVEVKERYLLVPATQIYKNVDIKRENADILEGNGDISKQRKEEKRKGEKRIKEIEKEKFGEFGNVLLTRKEYEKLTTYCQGKQDDYIARLDRYIQQSAKNRNKYTDHYSVIQTWYRKDYDKEEGKDGGAAKPAHNWNLNADYLV